MEIKIAWQKNLRPQKSAKYAKAILIIIAHPWPPSKWPIDQAKAGNLFVEPSENRGWADL